MTVDAVELFIKEAKHALQSSTLTSFPPWVLMAVADEIERLRAEVKQVTRRWEASNREIARLEEQLGVADAELEQHR